MSQQDEILEYLKTGKTLTPLEALNMFGTLRLSALIFNLKAEGHNIQAETNKDGKPFAIYRLVPKVLRNPVDTSPTLFQTKSPW